METKTDNPIAPSILIDILKITQNDGVKYKVRGRAMTRSEYRVQIIFWGRKNCTE